MAALTTKRRNALPSGKFAGPDRSYPIDTANRARNALARSSQFASPAVKGQVQRAVARNYPGIEQSKGPAAKAAKAPAKPAAKSTNQRLAGELDRRLDQRQAEKRR